MSRNDTLITMYIGFLDAALDTIHPEKGESWATLGYYKDSFTDDARSAAWRECRTFMNLAERHGHPVTDETATVVGRNFWLSRTEPDPTFNLVYSLREDAEYYDDLALCFGNIEVECDEDGVLNLA